MPSSSASSATSLPTSSDQSSDPSSATSSTMEYYGSYTPVLSKPLSIEFEAGPSTAQDAVPSSPSGGRIFSIPFSRGIFDNNFVRSKFFLMTNYVDLISLISVGWKEIVKHAALKLGKFRGVQIVASVRMGKLVEDGGVDEKIGYSHISCLAQKKTLRYLN